MKFYTSVIQWGNNILYRGFENGKRVSKRLPFQPTLFVPTNKDTDLKTLYEVPVAPIKFESIREAKTFLERYEDVSNVDIAGMTKFQYQFIAENFPGNIKYDPRSMVIWAIDIETAADSGFPSPDVAAEPILLITIKNICSERSITWGFGKPYTGNKDIVYRHFDNEQLMLADFLKYWRENYPDIVTGWNVDGFDIPYIVNRLDRVMGVGTSKSLSPWGIVNSRSVVIMKREKTIWEILGINVLDYLDLYRKFIVFSRESYSLDYIANLELGESKVKHDGSFSDFYKNDWNTFVEYNVHDTTLVYSLDRRLQFIDLVCSVAYLAKCELRDVFGPVRTWDVFIYNYLRDRNVVIPAQKSHSGASFDGGWVKDPIVGFHGWTVSFDFTSLYPSVIQQWNMSPETIVDQIPNVDVERFVAGDVNNDNGGFTLAANGARFRIDRRGVVPDVIKLVIDGRKKAKDEMLLLEKNHAPEGEISALRNKQLAYKILANALYGAISNPGFRYYDIRIAEAVTFTGQASDKHIEKTLNRYMNETLKTNAVDYIIAADTDSVYLNIDPLVQKVFREKKSPSIDSVVAFIDKICCGKMQDVINQSVAEIYRIGNCSTPVLGMKREAIASKSIWTTKKRYAMMVHNSEGVQYDPYELKIVGLDLIKSSSPTYVRGKLKEALEIILKGNQTELLDFVSCAKIEFMKQPVEDISFPRSVNGMAKYANARTIYGPKCPIAVRGALILNHLLRDDKTKMPIRDGDKVKFVYLREPNIARSDVIAFLSHDTLPESLGLHKKIDWDRMWEIGFISPLKGITDVIKWEVQRSANLDLFFQ